jgi:mediator of RNA polymerase II transcription subunit 7
MIEVRYKKISTNKLFLLFHLSKAVINTFIMAEESTAAATSSSTPKTSNAAPPPSQQHQESSHNDHDATQTTEEDDDMLLVTEFPPPPQYYALASRNTPAHLRLVPPEIPLRAFRVAAKKVRVERKRAKEESERIRLLACAGDGAAAAGSNDAAACNDGTKSASQDNDDDDSIDPNDPNEPVVAVFGEIVEDPTLTVDEECDDPTVIRENVKRLNQEVLRGFLKLVRGLVNDPNDNKLSGLENSSLFLMVGILLTAIIYVFRVI